jgi:hypothetical protein
MPIEAGRAFLTAGPWQLRRPVLKGRKARMIGSLGQRFKQVGRVAQFCIDASG